MSRNKPNKITPKELEAFLQKFDISNADFAHMLGVTEPAVQHWLNGRRDVPPTTVKLLRYFERRPVAMEEFT